MGFGSVFVVVVVYRPRPGNIGGGGNIGGILGGNNNSGGGGGGLIGGPIGGKAILRWCTEEVLMGRCGGFGE